MQIQRFIRAACVLGAVSAVGTADAAFVQFENFNDVALGSNLSAANAGENFEVGATNATTGGGFTVVLDPEGGTNQVLQSTVFNTGLTAPLGILSIPDNTTGTLFYRLRRAGTGTVPDFNLGLSDDGTTPSTTVNTGLFESQLNTSSTAQAGKFQVRDGTNNSGTASGFTVATNNVFTPGVYIGVFQVINNTTDTTEFYVQEGAATTPVKLVGGDNVYHFRNSTGAGPTLAANPLTNFLILASGAAATQDTFFVDDIYVDTAGQNLAAPVTIPEPSAVAVLGVGFIGLLARRRRA